MAIKCWHDLRHDDPSCIPWAEEFQLFGQRGAAHEGHAGVNHVWIEVARLLNEFGRRPIGGDHDHRFYWQAAPAGVARWSSRNGRVHIHGVALVIEPQNCAFVASERTDSFRYAGEAGSPYASCWAKTAICSGLSRLTFTRYCTVAAVSSA